MQHWKGADNFVWDGIRHIDMTRWVGLETEAW